MNFIYRLIGCGCKNLISPDTFLKMKLTIALLIATFLQIHAEGYSQQISLSQKNAQLEQVFKQIMTQTSYHFLYNKQMLEVAKPVNIELTNVSLQEALAKCFDGQPLTYIVENNTVIVKMKEVAFVVINGKVTNNKGEPLPGVSIIIKGTTKGVITDENGLFKLQINSNDKVLVISSIGMKKQEITINGRTEINVVMEEDVTLLGGVEVISTGYQRIKPEQSTGAIAQISAKEYESQINTDFLSGLANKIPGLMINNDVLLTSTDANGNTSSKSLFNIRGISTMSANQNPLIVIDGYPTELTMDMIDPNEIKSVTILKDAAASTVYGVRASNGVIVIERKQAKAGKPQFSFRATSGITPKENYDRYRWAKDASSIVANYYQSLYSKSINANTWAQLITKSSISGVGFELPYYLIAQQAANVITPYQAAQSFSALENYNNAKDYSNSFLRSAYTQTYSFDVYGGSPNALYYITSNYTGNLHEQIKNNDSRISLSARSTLKFSKRLSLELTTDYQEQYQNSAPIPDINSVSPYQHFTDVNGNPSFLTNGSGTNPYYNNALLSSGLVNNLYYPLVDINEISDKTHTVNNRVTTNFNYLLGRGFDLNFGGIYETSRSDLTHYASENSSEAKQYFNSYVTQNTDGTLKFNVPNGGFLRKQTGNTSSYTLRMQLNYNKKIGEQHSINGILGAEMRDVTGMNSIASYFGYNDQTLLQQPVDYTDIANQTISGTLIKSRSINFSSLFDQQYTEDRYLSGYANVVYAFRNTYSLTGSMRIDQSNLFGTNPKYKYKPLWSLGSAWNINKEKFMEDVSWVQTLKLRIAYGFNGNVAKMSLPQVIAKSVLNTYTSPTTTSLAVYSYANSSLRWEQTNNFNVGLDYSLFKKAYGSIDYYNKKSTDLLANTQIDPTIGVSPSLINHTTINNKGLEFSLHADWITTNNVNWNTGFVIAHNISKVLKVYQTDAYTQQFLNKKGYITGYPVGAIFAYRSAGLDSLGYPLIKDKKGNIYHTEYNSTLLTLMSSDTSGLIKYMGSSIPTVNAGLSNRIDIGNFYVYVMVNYYGGFKTVVPRPNPSSLRPLVGAGNYWKQAGDEANTDIMSITAYTSANANIAYNNADNFVVPGDYITLGDVTTSYSFDNSKFIKKAGFSHFEIKLQATNLWTVGLNKYNYSPATGSFAKSYITPTYTIGFFINF